MTHTASLSHCFVSAFAGWFATADLDDILTIKPTPDRDAVDINFCVSEGALQGYAQSSGISVAAMLGAILHSCLAVETMPSAAVALDG